MKNSTNTLLIMIFTITFFISVVLFFVSRNENNNIDNDIKIGKIYIKKYDDPNDPFDMPSIDTIKILDKKEGYVKWIKTRHLHDSLNFFISSKETYLKGNISEIK